MNSEDSIKNKLNHLKPTTVTKIYSSSGAVVELTRDAAGKIRTTKLDNSFPGYVVDYTPDLSISRVLPWLSVGSQDVSHDFELLKSNGITHILSIGVPSSEYESIKTTFVPAYDLENFRIMDEFEKCNHLIDSVRKQGGSIYVHCNAGISRSATIVAAYLIQSHKMNHLEALAKIKSVRPKINPNKGFVRQLEEYANQISQRLNQHNETSV